MWTLLVALAHATPEVRIEAGTDIPLAVSGGVLVEAGPRLRLRASAGVLPEAYADLANDTAAALFDSYAEPYPTLVDIALDKAWVVRVHAGWRPAAELGLYLHTGVTSLQASGGTTAAELVEAVTDAGLPRRVPRDGITLDAREGAWLLDLEAGWDQPLGEHLSLRAGLGWSFSVAANAHLAGTIEPAALQPTLDAIAAEGELEIERATRRYVHPPSLALALGWRF